MTIPLIFLLLFIFQVNFLANHHILLCLQNCISPRFELLGPPMPLLKSAFIYFFRMSFVLFLFLQQCTLLFKLFHNLIPLLAFSLAQSLL